MQRELDYLHMDKGGLVGWLRLRPPLMPIAVFLYCLFGKGLRAGIFYALQRHGSRSCAIPHGARGKSCATRPFDPPVMTLRRLDTGRRVWTLHRAGLPSRRISRPIISAFSLRSECYRGIVGEIIRVDPNPAPFGISIGSNH